MTKKILPLKSAPGPSLLKPRQVLQSWKEIASYLRVTVRTVQRWEKESGLPVHRQGTGQKARVLAYADEIDDWMTGHQAERQGTPSKWIRPVIIAGVVLLVATGVLVFLFFEAPPDVSTVGIEPTRLTAFDAAKQVLWHKELTEINVSHYAAGNDPYLVLNVDQDPEKEVLFNCAPQQSAQFPGRLICYDSNGDQLWEFKYGRERVHANRRISANYVGLRLIPVELGDHLRLLCVAGHHLWYPSQVALLDPRTGQLLDEYWHPGGLRSALVHDFDKDGQPEAVLSGINNPGVGLGYGCVVLLDLPFGKGNRSASGFESAFYDFTLGKELAYVLFPRPDVSDVQGMLPIVDSLSLTADKRVLVRVPGPDISLFYYLDYGLRLVDFRFADNLASVHDRLWRMGLLDHKLSQGEIDLLGQVRAFPTAPDGNSLEVQDQMRKWQLTTDH